MLACLVGYESSFTMASCGDRSRCRGTTCIYITFMYQIPPEWKTLKKEKRAFRGIFQPSAGTTLGEIDRMVKLCCGHSFSYFHARIKLDDLEITCTACYLIGDVKVLRFKPVLVRSMKSIFRILKGGTTSYRKDVRF